MITRERPSCGAAFDRSLKAFTFPELMVSMAIFTFLLIGIISAQIFGVKLFQITKTKLGASYQARVALSLLVGEIRSAKAVKIGAGDAASFTEVSPGSPQQGSALQIRPSTNATDFIRYYLDPNVKALKRIAAGASNATVIANSISNTVIFASEDYAGTVLTNNQNNRVIGVTLQFYQLENPSVVIGVGGLYDFYQLRTRVTRRALE